MKSPVAEGSGTPSTSRKITDCPVCGGRKFRFLYRTRDRLHGVDGRFTLCECRQCRLRFLSPQPGYDSLERYYVSDYTPYNRSADDWRDRLEIFLHRGLNSTEPRRHLFRPFEYLIRRGLVVRPGQKLLDVGCGSGNYLRIARRLGAQCYGADMYSGWKEALAAEGITFTEARAEDLDYPAGIFDVITLNHVLEHLADPKAVLARLRGFLAPDGLMIIQVPNGSSLVARIFGRFYQGIESPRHLFVFNKESLERLCEESGLRINRVAYRSPTTTNIFMLSLAFALEEAFSRGRPSPFIRAVLGNIVFRAALFPFSIVLGMLGAGDGLELFVTAGSTDTERPVR